jgi:hypothetical protein
VANNTNVAREISSSDPIFCLAKDNLEERNEFLDREAVENATDFAKLENRHKKFLWPESLNMEESRKGGDSPFNAGIYKAGRPIWTYRYL